MSTIQHTGRPAALGGPSLTGSRWRVRLVTVAGASLAALATWLVAESLFGLELHSPAANAGEAADIGASHVALAAAVGSLLGFGLLAVLERLTSRARRTWMVIAALGLLVSLGGPLSGSGITAANRVVLVLMHVVVAAVVVAGVYRASQPAPAAGRRS